MQRTRFALSLHGQIVSTTFRGFSTHINIKQLNSLIDQKSNSCRIIDSLIKSGGVIEWCVQRIELYVTRDFYYETTQCFVFFLIFLTKKTRKKYHYKKGGGGWGG